MNKSQGSTEIYGTDYWWTNQLTKNDLKCLEHIANHGDLPVLAGFKWELRYLSGMDMIVFDKNEQSFELTPKGREGLAYFKNRLF